MSNFFLVIGKNLTKGLGTGMSPDLGRKAIEETKEERANRQGVVKTPCFLFFFFA